MNINDARGEAVRRSFPISEFAPSSNNTGVLFMSSGGVKNCGPRCIHSTIMTSRILAFRAARSRLAEPDRARHDLFIN